MRRIITHISKRRFPYEPLITVTLSRNRLIGNLHEFMRIAPGGRVAPVLKSNAYGHGLIEVARMIESERHTDGRTKKDMIPFIIVDSFFEAVTLRAARIKTPILIIGYTRPETIARSRLKNVSFTVTSLETLRNIAKYEPSWFGWSGSRIRIHLKIDTGMHRQGIMPDELPAVDDILDTNPEIVLEGVCSHFADADNIDPSITESQIHIWNRIVANLHKQYSSLNHIHISNTDGHKYVHECHATMSRLGLGLYGLADGSKFSPSLDLKPVMEITSIISGIKRIKRDDIVGYGGTFQAQKDMTIATIPVGYYEGIDRRLSDKGTILVGDDRIPCPIIGRVSMNITTIDVSHVPDAKIGMPVIILSDDPQDQNSAINIAAKIHGIPYEPVILVPSQLKREVVD